MGISENIEFLSNLHGVSGYEQDVAAEIKKLFSPFCDECEIDTLGSVIGIKKSKNPQGKVMVEAHIDEVGLIITDIDENGFMYFEEVGGIDARTLLAQEVIVHGRRDIPGIIGAKPPHILTEKEGKEAVPVDKLYIDTGYGAEQIKEIVKVSDTVTLKNKTLHLLGGRISTKAQDDRTSVAVIVSVILAAVIAVQRVKFKNLVQQTEQSKKDLQEKESIMQKEAMIKAKEALHNEREQLNEDERERRREFAAIETKLSKREDLIETKEFDIVKEEKEILSDEKDV